MSDNEWIGKKLSEKDNPKVQRTVVGQQESTLLLDNNGRIEESRVSDVFNEVKSENVDPDNFFNGSYGTLLSAIHNPNQTKSIGVSDNNVQESVKMVVGNEDAKQALSTGQFKPKPEVQKNVNDNLHGLKPDGDVKRYYGESMKEYVDEEEFDRINNFQNKNTNTPKRKESIFSNMTLKKTTPIKIKLVIDEMIPKVDSIRSLNDLFEVSIIDHLSDEITEKYLRNPQLLKDLISETLEGIVYPKKKTTKKKPAKNSKTTTKTTAKKTVRKNSQTRVKAEVKNEDSSND